MSAGNSTSLCSSIAQASPLDLPHGKENQGVAANVIAKQVPLPAFALKQAAVNVSLSSSASSDVSLPVEQPTPGGATPTIVQPESDVHHVASSLAADQQVPQLSQPDQQPTVLQLLTQLDSIKWEKVANWASQDSAEAAALCSRLVPLMAESVIEEEHSKDDSISRLELQVARKKLVRSMSLLVCCRTLQIGAWYCNSGLHQ